MNNYITIVISHDSRDEKVAFELKQFLEEVFPNVEAYVSGRDLVGGQTWVNEIKDRLRTAHIIISLLTSKSLSNNWIHFESGAGFINDKTIPVLTDNLKLSDLVPPMSLLQARLMTDEGVRILLKDISKKLGQREPNNYRIINGFIDRIEKLLRNESTLLLKKLLPRKDFSPNAKEQWIYEENCLVHDYILKDDRHIAIDTYFYIDRTEIQLFGRTGSEDFVLNSMIKAKGFLPQSFTQYEQKGNRLIFKSLGSNESVDLVAKELSELLSKVESYIMGH